MKRYTGMKDKNGIEIYEGDIVYEPDWWWGAGVVNLHCYEDNKQSLRWIAGTVFNTWDLSKIEVIGNIKDNPDYVGYGKRNNISYARYELGLKKFLEEEIMREMIDKHLSKINKHVENN